jgi:hypothetical protein
MKNIFVRSDDGGPLGAVEMIHGNLPALLKGRSFLITALGTGNDLQLLSNN